MDETELIMDKDANDVSRLIEDVSKTPLIQTRDIPKVDLYMEQVTSFFEQEMQGFARDPEDKVFTNTMINNYAKAGILPRPSKKRYGRRHIITLIYIFLLKQVLSFQDIGEFFNVMKDKDHEQLEGFYDIYREMADEYRSQYAKVNCERYAAIGQRLKERGLEGARYQKMMLLSLLSLEATAHKMVCTRLLDTSKEPTENKKH